MDVEGKDGVAALGPEQMVDFYRDRLRQEKTRVERIEEMAKERENPCEDWGSSETRPEREERRRSVRKSRGKF